MMTSNISEDRALLNIQTLLKHKDCEVINRRLSDRKKVPVTAPVAAPVAVRNESGSSFLGTLFGDFIGGGDSTRHTAGYAQLPEGPDISTKKKL